MIQNQGVFGVSPAYFISRFPDRFTPVQVAACLPDLAEDGFDTFQPEVFHPAELDSWLEKGAAGVAAAARDCGLSASQFVAHFLLHAFESPEAVDSPWGVEETLKSLDVMSRFSDCRILTVPLPALEITAPSHLTPAGHATILGRMVDKLRRMVEYASQAGCRLSVEMMPGNPWQGIHGFLRLAGDVRDGGLGYNFDTGHAWSCREWVPGIPALAGNRILGTHLKDNHQTGNLALAPGEGSIPWRPTLEALVESGYRGSWDVEFRCPPEIARSAYARAMRFVRPIVEAAIAAASRT